MLQVSKEFRINIMMVSSFKILSIYLLTNVSWWLGGIWANAKQTNWIFLILYPGLEYYLNTNDDWWWLKNDAFKSIGNRNIWILEKGETFFLVYACKRDLLGLVKYFWWCWFSLIQPSEDRKSLELLTHKSSFCACLTEQFGSPKQ